MNWLLRSRTVAVLGAAQSGAHPSPVPHAGHLLNWERAEELVDVIESVPAQHHSG
jgi:hypothetical protein